MAETATKKQKRKMKKRKILRKVYQRTQRNKQITKKIRVLLKNLKKSILSLKPDSLEQDKSKVEEMLRNFYKEVDKAVSKGVLHKNEAARKKSRITTLYNKYANPTKQLTKT